MDRYELVAWVLGAWAIGLATGILTGFLQWKLKGQRSFVETCGEMWVSGEKAVKCSLQLGHPGIHLSINNIMDLTNKVSQ